MRVLVTKWFGCVVLEGGRVVERKDFPRDAHAIAERLLRIRRGEILDEERALAAQNVGVTESRLRSLGSLQTAAKAPAIDRGGASPELVHEAALLVARDEMKKAAGERDRFVVQSVRAMDEVTRTTNTLMERLREWYALHYPEALRHVTDQAKLAKALAEAPDRASVAAKLGAKAPEDSIGTTFTSDELAAIRGFARNLAELFNERSRLEALIGRDVAQVAPTLSGFVGPNIAARLISQANGLERLASFPSSTVQTLGAENALFLHLKEGKRPPKHGVLFQHALINTAPRWQRGRIARLMAGLASQAARMDCFGTEKTDRSATLKADLEAHLKRLRARKPPPFRRPGPPHAHKAGPRPRAMAPRRRA